VRYISMRVSGKRDSYGFRIGLARLRDILVKDRDLR